MPNVPTRFSSVAQALTPAATPSISAELNARLGALYTLAQRSEHVFASPVGPFQHRARLFNLPRFAYFGPHTSDESPRLAFYAGENRSDLRGTLSLLHLVERFALDPVVGHGLNLSFFPLLDIIGEPTDAPARQLAHEHWGFSPQPEIALLEKDIRLRSYHGFVRMVSATDDLVGVRLRSRSALGTLGTELITSEDVAPWQVRFEAEELQTEPASGPLTVGDDLPYLPFELTLALPADWPQPLTDAATVSILTRFLERYRGHRGYAQNI